MEKPIHPIQLSDAALLACLTGLPAGVTETWLSRGLRPLVCAEPTAGYAAGIPAHALHKLGAAWELTRRAMEQSMREQPIQLTTPGLVRDYLHLLLAARSYEVFVVLYLDAKNHLIEAEELFRGTLTQTSVYPREVVMGALSPHRNAAAVIFAHNHPSSGCAEPSRADEHLTALLKTALALVDIKVLDHFVVASDGVVSFAERGLL